MTNKFTPADEKAARVIAMSRGTDPDAPVTIGNPDGSADYFETAWHGYVPMARLIAQALDPKQPDPPLAREVIEQPKPRPAEPPFVHVHRRPEPN